MKKFAAIVVAIVGLAVIWSPQLASLGLDFVLPSKPAAVATDGDLAKLVPSGEQKTVGAFYRDLAGVVLASKDVTTTDQLRSGYRSAVGMLQSAGKLPPGLGDFDKAVGDRLTTAIGKQSQPLTDDLRNKFADVCTGVAADLGVK